MRRPLHNASYFLLCALVISCAGPKVADTNQNIYSTKYIDAVMHRVFTWQIKNPVTGNTAAVDDWARAVFYVGITRAYEQTKKQDYLAEAIRWSEGLHYQLGPRLRHADDHTRGQVFLDIYSVKKDTAMLGPVQRQFDTIMLTPQMYPHERWWCDALFMSPPVWARLAQATGRQQYNEYMNRMWWDVTDFLFDKEENLYYRDQSFFEKRTSHGKKIFWARGNGWVSGGLVQILERLPKNNTDYKRYLELYKKMMARIITLQNPDGLWPPGLVDAEEFPNKETSGSGFFVFALAWGINNGMLEKQQYLPAVQKGWQALINAVQQDGKLTYVQKIGSKPESVKETDNQEYGSGAFLMAGSEMLKLSVKK